MRFVGRLKVIFLILVLYYAVKYLAAEWSTFSSINWTSSSQLIASFIISFVFSYYLGLVIWHWITKLFISKTNFVNNCRIWISSSLARYIPGGLWQYPSRVMLLSECGLSKKSAGLSLLVELLLLIWSGLIVVGFTSYTLLPISVIYYVLLNICILFLLPYSFKFVSKSVLAPSIEKHIVIRLFNSKVTLNTIYKDIFSNNKLLSLILVSVVRHVVVGMSFYYLLLMIGLPVNVSMIKVIGGYTTSWLIGYIALFSPGGIGIREGAIVVLFNELIPKTTLVSASIVYRLLVLLLEIAIYTTIAVINKYEKTE